jgi:2-dehydro-3-deoxyphosphogluconate aldolase / (4S)-4-hydroxy-2-oxoglutarate aldolase
MIPPTTSADGERPAGNLIDVLWHLGLIPAVQLPTPGMAVPLADALLEGGLPIIEVTFRAAGASEAIREIRTSRPSMLVGAGTVLTVEQAEAALDAGAQFIVAPGTNAQVVDYVLGRDGLMFPGVATPSEIEANLHRGLATLKFFPAGVLGGVDFLRAMSGPYKDVRFVPTGGVSLANLAQYLSQPNVLACAGTWIAPPASLKPDTLDVVVLATRAAVEIVRSVRPNGEPVTADAVAAALGRSGHANND